jgi:thiamine-phosphate pyrophosphorylase
MKVIVITSEKFLEKEEQALNMLFESGLEILHLRKPGSEKTEFEDLLRKISEQYHSRIVIHDHFSLTEEYDLKGVHLNRRNPVYEGNKHLSVSCSCHTLGEVSECKKYDYLFLSPIFDSISKSGYTSGFSDNDLLKAAGEGIIDSKVVALGGVDASNIGNLKSYGFGGAAVLGILWKGFERECDFEKLIATYSNLKEKSC